MSINVKPKRRGQAIEAPSSASEGLLRARASIPLDGPQSQPSSENGEWQNKNSQTYSGMMTPSAAPSRRPVPRLVSVDMCVP